MPRVKLTAPTFGREDTGVAILLDGASVQVDDADGNAATVYEDDTGGTTITNPVTSDNGNLPGWVAEGSYSLTPTFDGVTGDAMPFEARAAYPSGASDGDVLSFDGDTSEVAWANPSELAGGLPWKIDINVFTTPATVTGFTTLSQQSGDFMGGRRTNGSGAQNDQIGWDVVLAAGTWTFDMIHHTGSGRGIYTVSLDGTSIGTTVDGYDGSGALNVFKTITGITVSTTGKKRLLLKMATKNASSSGYQGTFSFISLTRTA